MTDRERNLAIFRRDPGCGVLWQPRLGNWHRRRLETGGPAPAVAALHDSLGASLRPYMFYRKAFAAAYDRGVAVEDRQEPGGMRRTYATPLGSLTAFYGRTGEGYCWTEYPVKSPADVRVMLYVLQSTHYRYDEGKFLEAEAETGQRAAPQTIAPRTGLQEILVNLMGVQGCAFAFADEPELMDEFQARINESYDSYYEAVCRSPVRIVNFGDNLHCGVTPPAWFLRYVLPWYQRRSAQLHGRGIFCTAHWDGDVKAYLPYIGQTGLDGVEAITPRPQGDVELDCVAEHMAGKILLDGIPAVYFLDSYGEGELEACVGRLLELFGGRLVLGISDEMPGDGRIERVAAVGRWVSQYNERNGREGKS